MKINRLDLKEILPTVIICGLLGGALMIIVPFFTNKGFLQVTPYFLIFIFIRLALRTALKKFKKMEMNYLKAFITGVLTFMLMTYIYYFYVMIWENPHNGILLWGHIWRLLFIFGAATILSAILALFFAKQIKNIK